MPTTPNIARRIQLTLSSLNYRYWLQSSQVHKQHNSRRVSKIAYFDKGVYKKVYIAQGAKLSTCTARNSRKQISI